MSINIQNETLLTLSDAALRIPEVGGRRPHPSSLWRWARFGINGVRLEYLRVGQRICTSVEAINRFMQRLAESDRQVCAAKAPKRPSRPVPRTDPDQAKARADSALGREGSTGS